MHEIRRLVREDTARFQRLADAWNEMTIAEQEQIVAQAEAIAAEPRDDE